MTVAGEAVEPVSELFGRLGDGGVTIEEAITPIYEEPGFIRHTEKPVVLRTYIPNDDRAQARRQEIEEAVWHLNQIWPVGELQVGTVDEADWANAWKDHYSVFRIGHRCVIKPEWLEYDEQPGDIVLDLDPGMAFGTGQHPTTAQCLELIERVVQPGQRVLDVGTGSGILSIAALKLGAASAVLLDIDPIATRSAAENLERNRVLDRALIETGSLPHDAAPAGHFDVVLANIIASAIIALAPELRRAAVEGGQLIASGIIASREPDVRAALDAAGYRIDETLQDQDWRTLLATSV
jgi:ribosomal protein L11 methyltransferase